MSGGDDDIFWVSDIDGYVNIDAINRANEDEAQEKALQDDLDEIGEVQLLSGKAISARTLNDRGISPSEWRLATYQAERKLHDCQDWSCLEPFFVKDLLSLGKRYAVARYAKWENISFSAALTATFPHGFRALLYQFLDNQTAINKLAQRRAIQLSLQLAFKATDLPAYHRVGIVRSAIHQSAIDALGPTGHLHLEKKGMRIILSLARLHYSVAEIGVRSLRELQHLNSMYEDARLNVVREVGHHQPLTGKHVPNWELRHLHPLTHLYPYSIRNAFIRAIKHLENPPEPLSRAIAVNELALARCEISLMGRDAISSAES